MYSRKFLNNLIFEDRSTTLLLSVSSMSHSLYVIRTRIWFIFCLAQSIISCQRIDWLWIDWFLFLVSSCPRNLFTFFHLIPVCVKSLYFIVWCKRRPDSLYFCVSVRIYHRYTIRTSTINVSIPHQKACWKVIVGRKICSHVRYTWWNHFLIIKKLLIRLLKRWR